MNRLLLSFAAFVVAGATLCAEELALPTFYKHSYEVSRRDPLIAADAASTLVGGAPVANANQIAAGNALQTLLADVAIQLRSTLTIGGIIAGAGGQGRAFISGVDLGTGDRINVPIKKDLNARLQGVLRTYGGSAQRLGLDAERETLVLIVGNISSSGVCLNLPGFQTPICFLPYDRKLRLEPRRIDAPVSAK